MLAWISSCLNVLGRKTGLYASHDVLEELGQGAGESLRCKDVNKPNGQVLSARQMHPQMV